MSHVEERKKEIVAAKVDSLFAHYEQIGGPEGVIRITWFLETPESRPSAESLRYLKRYLNLRLKTSERPPKVRNPE